MGDRVWKAIAAALGVAAIAVGLLVSGPGRAGALWLAGFAMFAWTQGRPEPEVNVGTMQRRALVLALGVTAATGAAVAGAVFGSEANRGRFIGTAILLGVLACSVWVLWSRGQKVLHDSAT